MVFKLQMMSSVNEAKLFLMVMALNKKVLISEKSCRHELSKNYNQRVLAISMWYRLTVNRFYRDGE